jgi:hypothetical protein
VTVEADDMTRRILILVLTTFAGASWATAAMADGHKAKTWRREKISPARDCTPINGFYGYYGNPWCDTGSYRLEDIWFREQQRAAGIASRKLR